MPTKGSFYLKHGFTKTGVFSDQEHRKEVDISAAQLEFDCPTISH